MIALRLWAALALCTVALGSVVHRHGASIHADVSDSRKIADVLKTSEYYLNNGKSFVEQQAKKQPNTKIAKNVILFLGDGMSVPTLTAARMYMGGEEKSLSFEEFPHLGMSKTYCVDYQVADSACTATGAL